MSPIRPFVAADSAEVAGLYERVIRSGSRTPPPHLARYFERTFLEHPWADPEIPSLVYEDARRRLVGFIGSHVRRLRFDGEPIRMACSGQLVVAPEARREAPGAFLLREYLSGPQELTITDGANDRARRLWTGLGGETLHLSCLDWIRVLRPAAVAAQYAARGRGGAAFRPAAPLIALVDAAGTRLPPFRSDARQPGGTVEELTPAALLGHLTAVTRGLRLYPDYDGAFLDWLFAEMAEVGTRGRLVRSLVRGRDGRLQGWYVAYFPRRGVVEAVQVAAVERAAGHVLDRLFHEARRSGASAVRGRVEPSLLASLGARRCVLRYTGGSLAHSPRPEILAAVRRGQALLTRLEGEWWMGHHIEPFS